MIRAAILTALAAVLTGLSEPALAYVGPGAGLGAVGAALGLLATIVMAFALILFWPVRRLLRRGKRKAADSGGSDPAEAPESSPGP